MKKRLERIGRPFVIAMLLASGLAMPSYAQQAEDGLSEGIFDTRGQVRYSAPRRGWQYLLAAVGPHELRGRSDSESFDIYLTEPADGRILIGYEMSQNMAPDRSRLALSVNGAEIAATHLQSAEGEQAGRWVVPLAATALRPGWNRLKLRADLRRTGVCAAGPEGQAVLRLRPESSLIDLPRQSLSARVDPGVDGQLDVVILEPDLGNADAVSKAFAAAQEVGRRLPDAVATLQLRTAWPDDPPDFIIDMGEAETSGNVRRMRFGTFLETVPLPPAGNTVDVTEIQSGKRYSFADLGLHTQGWSERYHEIVIQFVLPDDFYGMQTGSLRLDLRAITAQALSSDARMDVVLNGARAASTLLAGDNIGRTRTWSVDVPLHEARAGLNAMTLIFDIPPQEGDACLSEANQNEEPLFGVYESSTVKLSGFARASVASPAATLSPGGGEPVQIVTVRASEALYSAAARLLAAVAAATDVTHPVRVSTSASADTNALFIAGAADLDPRIGDWFGLSQAKLRAWQRRNTDVSGPSDPSQAWIDDASSRSWASALRHRIGQTWGRSQAGTFPQTGDTAALISSPTPTGSRTLFLARSHGTLAEAARLVQLAPRSMLHSPDVVLDAKGDLRALDTMRSARPSNYSPGNLRLFAASFFSEHVWLYATLVILTAAILGMLSWLALSHGSKE